MPATLTITSPNAELGPTRGPAGRVRETLKVVGASSAAADTGTVQPVYCKKNIIAFGGVFTVSESVGIGGTTLTLTAIPALASNTVYVEIEGDF